MKKHLYFQGKNDETYYVLLKIRGQCERITKFFVIQFSFGYYAFLLTLGFIMVMYFLATDGFIDAKRLFVPYVF